MNTFNILFFLIILSLLFIYFTIRDQDDLFDTMMALTMIAMIQRSQAISSSVAVWVLLYICISAGIIFVCRDYLYWLVADGIYIIVVGPYYVTNNLTLTVAVMMAFELLMCVTMNIAETWFHENATLMEDEEEKNPK